MQHSSPGARREHMSAEPSSPNQLQPSITTEESLPERIFDAHSAQRLIDWEELWFYRDMLFFMVWRDFKSQYAQSVLGIGWAILPPLFRVVVFTIVFGRLAQISSDGVPYALFSFAALVPWGYFSESLSGASNSMISGMALISKVYFPRMLLPVAAVLRRLPDLFIGLVMLSILLLWFQIIPTIWVAILPLLILMMMLTAMGAGMLLTALAVQYRDVKLALGFFSSTLMYASPVIYPASLVPSTYRLLYALNPMVGVIEGFRSALLATNPMPWDLIGVGAATSLVMFFVGLVYFRHRERVFADVV